MSKNTLESKVWYRFIKVIFISLNIIAFLIVLAISYFGFKPNTIIDATKSTIHCNNGKNYNAGDNNIYGVYDSYLDSNSDTEARKLCEYNILNDYSNSYTTPDTQNYTLSVGYSTTGSWNNAFWSWLIGIAIVGGVSEISKRVFFYIVTGKA